MDSGYNFSVTITVRFFAVLRDRAGTDLLEVSFPPGTDVAGVIEEVAARFPAIASLLVSVAPAVNREYVPRTHTLRDGDELALIPPVSGG